MITVYLAGPISRVTFNQATKWRIEAAALLNTLGIETFDPMLNKHEPEGGLNAIITQDDALSSMTKEQVFNRDMDNIDMSDVLLVNLIDFHGSIGTPFEIGRAWAEGVPTVVFGAGRWESHPFSTAFSYIALDLQEAVDIIEAIVTPNDVLTEFEATPINA